MLLYIFYLVYIIFMQLYTPIYLIILSFIIYKLRCIIQILILAGQADFSCD